MWSNVRHPNVVRLIGFHADLPKNEAWFITRWEENGNIRRYLRGRDITVLELMRMVRPFLLSGQEVIQSLKLLSSGALRKLWPISIPLTSRYVTVTSNQ